MENTVRAGFWIRVLASLLDAVFLLPAVGLFLGLYYLGDQRGYSEAVLDRWLNVLICVLGLGYWSMEVFKAASPGKLVLGMRIRNADGTDAPQSRLLMRSLTKNSPLIWSLFGSLLQIAALEWLSNLSN